MILKLEGTVQRLIGQLKDSLTTHMAENERGPLDYAPSRGEMEHIADRAVRRGLRDRFEIKNEGPRNEGSQSWQTWILGIVGLLIAAGVGALNYQLSDLKADVRAALTRQELDEKRIDNLERHVYRGTD